MSKKKFALIFSIISIIVIGILIVLLLFPKKTINSKKDILIEEEPIVEPEKPKLKIIDEDSNTRNIAVMINNHNQARPNHAGLQDAYIVYEIIVEGGITRMMAIFKDKDITKIGSVRSSRPYYLDYAMENDAVYVHFGGSDQAYSDIRSLNIDHIDGMADDGFWRDNNLNVDREHKAFTNMENIKNNIEKKKIRNTTEIPSLLNYSIDEINIDSLENAVPANNISIKYSYYMTSSYVYDEVTKLYKRFANGIEHKDGVTGEQYTTKNIIVAQIPNYSVDSYGRQGLNNIGTGNGYYITNGYAVPITWNKSSRSEQTIYRYLNGEEIIVNDGNTYIQIQPLNQELLIY